MHRFKNFILGIWVELFFCAALIAGSLLATILIHALFNKSVN